MLKLLWIESTSYLLERDVPALTVSVADSGRRLLTMPLAMLQRAVNTSPPRLLIFLTLIACLLVGAWII